MARFETESDEQAEAALRPPEAPSQGCRPEVRRKVHAGDSIAAPARKKASARTDPAEEPHPCLSRWPSPASPRAERARVSTATVSRFLNTPDAVSPELRARIVAVIEEVGYIPDASARALSVRRTKTIGAIIPTVDNAKAGRTITQHLVGLGHRKIGMVAAMQRNNDRAQARLGGVLEVLDEAGIPPPPEWTVQVHYKLDEARAAARYLLSLRDRPTAVVCGNDVIACGVLLEADKLGIAVPGQVSVVGFDDLEWSRHLRPSLTTIHMPTDEIWRRAGEYLVQTLAGIPAIKHHEVDFSLVVRESTTFAPDRVEKAEKPAFYHSA